jgi:putative ABC transport system ATP-binding protein
MSDKRKATPRTLSGGQQQRVAIARALVANAPVLLCDEPTASVDSVTGQLILKTLRRLARDSRRAVVVVTHDERILPFGDRLIHVSDGRAREEQHVAKRELHEVS